MPPEVTITAWAFSAKSPTTVREEGAPRSTPLGSRMSPATPSTTPADCVSAFTRWRKRSDTRPALAASRTLATNGAMSAGPVPQVMWKRGTELPCSVAV